uniref:BZIP domain-containing protein n=1 Tax=Meloidogyne javanica TaxID=6303 RepID=A0A915LUV1_MELJA
MSADRSLRRKRNAAEVAESNVQNQMDEQHNEFNFSDQEQPGVDNYALKRLKNNAAVNKTRQKKRLEQENTSKRVKELREENAQLERSLDSMRRELALLKEMVVVCAAKGDAHQPVQKDLSNNKRTKGGPPTRNIPTREQFENRGFSIGCLGRNQENPCSSNVCYHLRYRTFDGSCNNLVEGRSLRGAAFMPFGRLRPANYEDGVARMVGTSKPMPNPRTVTHLLLSSSFVVLTVFNGLLMQFGQFLSHDITRNTVTNFCRCETVHEECANMPVPLHDTRFKKQQPNFCIPMTRSSVLCGTGSGRQGPGRIPRTPINENGAWIDASQAGKFFENFLKIFKNF